MKKNEILELKKDGRNVEEILTNFVKSKIVPKEFERLNYKKHLVVAHEDVTTSVIDIILNTDEEIDGGYVRGFGFIKLDRGGLFIWKLKEEVIEEEEEEIDLDEYVEKRR